jgi:hypothetical protein
VSFTVQPAADGLAVTPTLAYMQVDLVAIVVEVARGALNSQLRMAQAAVAHAVQFPTVGVIAEIEARSIGGCL